MNSLSSAGAAVAAASSLAPNLSGDVLIAQECANDVTARELLLDRAFGPGRHLKTSARLRTGRLPAQGLAFVAHDPVTGQLLGTVRLWNVRLGNVATGDWRPALLLGPLAVDPDAQGRGIGAILMCHAISEARERGHAALILVGDPEYYGRLGFDALCVANLSLPGPVERHRFLGLELRRDALVGACGLVRAAGPKILAGNDHQGRAVTP